MTSRFVEHEAADASFEDSSIQDNENLKDIFAEDSFIVNDSEISDESCITIDGTSAELSRIDEDDDADEVRLLVAEAKRFIGTTKSTLKASELVFTKKKNLLIQPLQGQ